MDESNFEIKESSIPNSGKGLYSKIFIKEGSIILYFSGNIKQKSENGRSSIRMNNGLILDCSDEDLASYANDCIIFPQNRRDIMEILNSPNPFYEKYPGTKLNARISQDLTGCYLRAIEDIEPGDEIFCHYGLAYWLRREMKTNGFFWNHKMNNDVQEKQIYYIVLSAIFSFDYLSRFGKRSETKISIADYPSIKSYISIFYENFEISQKKKSLFGFKIKQGCLISVHIDLSFLIHCKMQDSIIKC